MLRGNLNERRTRVVANLFNRYDRSGRGEVELQVLEGAFRAQNHPAVRSGQRHVDAIVNEFHYAWSTQQKTGCISRQEFFDYFTEVGAHIKSDEEFETMLRDLWC